MPSCVLRKDTGMERETVEFWADVLEALLNYWGEAKGLKLFSDLIECMSARQSG